MEFRDEYVPLSTTKFGWSVKIKWIQEVKLGRRGVGSEDVRTWRRAPFTVVLSFFHRKEYLTLKCPRIIVKREVDDAVVSKISSKFDKHYSNSALFWLGDL